ncbi:MAG: TetR/AcrR family transcriptional regulator [Actinomycetota bacterium]|jgi:AcrR family transcriptional regulator
MADQSRRVEALLEEVLDAAEEIIEKHGSEGLSVRAVAQHVGISVGNLQYHLPTRAKLLDAVFRRRAEQFKSELFDAVEEIEDVKRRFAVLIDFWLSSQHNADQMLFWHLWAMSAHDADASVTMSAVYGELVDFVADLIGAIDETMTRASARRRAAVITSVIEGSGLFVGYGREPEPSLRSLQREVRSVVMGLAGCDGIPVQRIASKRKR